MQTKERIKQTAADFMPWDENSQLILRARAEQLAKLSIEEKTIQETFSYIRFRLGNHEEYGISYQYAKEVMHHVSPVRLPQAPAFIAGVINRRGALIAVINLKQIFRTGNEEYDQNTSIIIVSANGMTVGILADSIIGSDVYDPAMLDLPLPSDSVLKPEYIQGIYRSRVTLINIHALLNDPQLMNKSTTRRLL